jgi:hypothetical protein
MKEAFKSELHGQLIMSQFFCQKFALYYYQLNGKIDVLILQRGTSEWFRLCGVTNVVFFVCILSAVKLLFFPYSTGSIAGI